MEQRRSRIWYIVAGIILAALIAVLWIRYAGTQKLIADLDSKDPRVQQRAARVLLQRQVLEDSLPAQPETRRAHAAAALARVASAGGSKQLIERAMEQLVALIKDPEDLPQRAASKAMGQLGALSIRYLVEERDGKLPVIQDGDARAKEAAVNALALIGEAAVPALTAALEHPDRREQAAIALGKIGGTGLEPLLDAAWSKDRDLRRIAIRVLGEVREKRAVEAAIDALRYRDLRQTAIIALGLIADRRAAPQVMPYLKDPDLRIDAATALGAMEDVRAAAPLLVELRDPEKQFHDRAVWALQRIGAPAAPLLVAALKSDSVYVRRAAAEGLRWTHQAATIPALAAALRDPDAKVRAAAARALGWLGNAAAIEALLAGFGDRDWRVADACVSALADIGAVAVDHVIGLFDSPDPVRQMLASDALARMDQPPVQRLLQSTHSPSAATRKWAALTLGKIGDRAAAQRLREMAASASGDEQWAAREALRKLGV